jgi:hypothetical protein
VIRVAATILVAVQALLPPGMCFCQFVPSVPVARQAYETAPPPRPSVADEEPCCSCPACRAAVTAVPVPHDQAPTDREPPQKHDPLPAPPAPCSGCPVVAAGPVGRVVILTATEQAPLDLAVQFVAPSVEVTIRRTDRPDPSPPSATPPLFVRHCALLI